MKNPKYILIGIFILLILAALGFYYWSTNSNAQISVRESLSSIQNQQDLADTNETLSEDEDSFVGNILDLAKLGKTVKCTYEAEYEGSKMSGVTYISGDKIRADFTTTDAENEKVDGHMILDGSWEYTWTTLSDQGVKMNIKDLENKVQQNTDGTNSDKSFDALSDDVKYNCTKWAADNSMFEVPNNINFVDFTETLDSFTSESEEGGLCSACDFAQTQEAIDACKQQLGCN